MLGAILDKTSLFKNLYYTHKIVISLKDEYIQNKGWIWFGYAESESYSMGCNQLWLVWRAQ